MNKILVIAAHPDDEVLGCGATMAKHVDAGDEVNVVIMAEGITSRDDKGDADTVKQELKQLQETARVANTLLGVTHVDFCNFPDNRMDSVDILDIVKKVETFIEQYKPDVIYTHNPGDVNIDHQLTSKAVVTACRPVPGQEVKKILFFEVPSSTEWQIFPIAQIFMPNCFEHVSTSFEKKLEALKIYESEMRDFPHPRSLEAVEALAKWRGATVGADYVEAFMLGRLINI